MKDPLTRSNSRTPTQHNKQVTTGAKEVSEREASRPAKGKFSEEVEIRSISESGSKI